MTDLTPTEDLILEVLAARARLGESLWTFDSRHGRALRGLEGKGLVSLMHGMTENTLRASLTEKGTDEALSPTYTPPAPADDVEGLLAEAMDLLQAARCALIDPGVVRSWAQRRRRLSDKVIDRGGVL